MPGRRCAVFGCNNSKIASKSKGVNIIFHNFPKGSDMASSTMRSEWIHRCKRADKLNPFTSQICSIHFTENDYERDLKNELLGLTLKKKLKKTAVPTLHVPQTPQHKNPGKTSGREKRFVKKQQKRVIQKLIDEQITELINNSVTPSTSFYSDVSEVPDETSSSFHKAIPVSADKKYTELQEQYEKMKKEFHDYKLQKQRKIKLLNKQLKYYKNKYNSIREPANKDKGLKLLKMILTDNQITVFSKKKKWVK